MTNFQRLVLKTLYTLLWQVMRNGNAQYPIAPVGYGPNTVLAELSEAIEA